MSIRQYQYNDILLTKNLTKSNSHWIGFTSLAVRISLPCIVGHLHLYIAVQSTKEFQISLALTRTDEHLIKESTI